METVFFLVGILFGILFWYNKKITESVIATNIGILEMKDYFFREVYKYVSGKDDQKPMFEIVSKEALFFYMRRFAWNPLRSILPFESSFMPPNLYELVKSQERFIKQNEHMAFIVSGKKNVQEELKKISSNIHIVAKKLLEPQGETND